MESLIDSDGVEWKFVGNPNLKCVCLSTHKCIQGFELHGEQPWISIPGISGYVCSKMYKKVVDKNNSL